MLVGEGRALRRDYVLHTGHEARDQIQLAFANDGETGVKNRALGFVETEKNFALGENRRFGRVDILGGFFVAGQNASAETNHPALLIANRENQTSAKTVVVISSFLFANN